MLGSEGGDVLRQVRIEDRIRKNGYAAYRCLFRSPHQILESSCVAQEVLRLGVGAGALFRQAAHLASPADEELAADLCLELIDLVADGGRGDVQNIRASPKAACFDHGYKDLEPSKCHSRHRKIPLDRPDAVIEK